MFKHGLYINNIRVDIDNDDIYLFNYSNVDISKPDAVKNTYSKTITLQGTPNNNRIFNLIYHTEYINLGSTLFNPSKRTPFEIYNNSSLIESGYMQLNTVKYFKNNPIYDITLYGMLGDFFYGLMYDADGNELTLKDITYDLWHVDTNYILGEDPTYDINEHITSVDDSNANNTLFVWDKTYIWNSWLCSFTDKFTNVNHNLWEQFITAVPCNTGYHDKFDNNKIIVNMNYPTEYDDILPHSFIKDNNTYTTLYDYSLLTTQREMIEWEIRDLRSQFQIPAIRFGKLMQFITDYSKQVNNYNIVWDEDIDITNTKPQDSTLLNDYFWRTYIMLDQLEFQDDYNIQIEVPEISDEWSSIADPVEFYLSDLDHNIEFDLTDIVNPSITLTINEEYRPFNFKDDDTYCYDDINAGYITPTVKFGTRDDGHTINVYNSNYYGIFTYKIEVLVNDTVDNKYTKVLFISCYDPQNYTLVDDDRDLFPSLNRFLGNLANSMGAASWELIIAQPMNATRPALNYNFIAFKDAINTSIFNLPNESNVKIRVTKSYNGLYYDAIGRRSTYSGWKIITSIYNELTNKYEDHIIGTNLISCSSDSQLYLCNFKDTYYVHAQVISGISTITKNRNVTKQILLNNTSSLFKYIIDWCKLFNLRFRTDILTRTIYIEQRKHYYIDTVVNINDKIDYSKNFVIDPLYVDNNIYEFGIHNTENETYADYIYNKHTGDNKYSNKTLLTDYEFNNDTLKVFEDNIYKVNTDYTFKTPYLNTTLINNGVQYPPMLLMPKYEYQLWNNDEVDNKVMYGLQSYKAIPFKEDVCNRPCLFDKDFNTLTSNNSLVLFDNLYTIPVKISSREIYMPYILTDDLQVMDKLNDGNSCYINSYYNENNYDIYDGDNYDVARKCMGIINTNLQTGTIGLWTFMLPHMRAMFSDTSHNGMYYFRDMYDVNNINTIYNQWWNSYESDVLNVDTKTVECYVFLEDIPDTALRKIYYFNNSLWSLISITDYNFNTHKPVKCKFIQIQNKQNYI